MMKTLQRRGGVADVVSAAAVKFLDAVSRHFVRSYSGNAIETSFSIVEPALPLDFYTDALQGYSLRFVFKFAGAPSRDREELTLKYHELADVDHEKIAREVVAALAVKRFVMN